MVNNRFKLVLHDRKEGKPKVELFEPRDNPGETRNLSTKQPDVLQAMKQQMRERQTSVLMTLTGSDYHQ